MERNRAVDVSAVDRLIALVERLVGLPWSIRLDRFDSTAKQLGWSLTDEPGFYTGNLASGEERIMLIEDKSKNTNVVTLPFFKPGGQGFEEIGLISDAFIAYAMAGIKVWGKSFQTVTDKRFHVAWKYPQDVIVKSSRSDLSARLNFYTPQGIRVY